MLSLYIDGQRVPIDADTQLEVVRENPVLSKAGEYSYDIDIDLRVPENQRLYKGANHFRNTAVPSGRKAVVMDGSVVVCMGTEVVLELTDQKAKIQIVCGNSEFNYLLGDDQKVRRMNFGAFSDFATPSRTRARYVRDRCYPEVVDAYPPMVKGTDSIIYSDGCESYMAYNKFVLNDNDYKSTTQFLPQPYLLYYVEKIVELLGYTLESNCLRSDERWLHLIVVHSNDTNLLAECLPDWTAAKFINEVEKFFNVVYLVDGTSHKVRIVSMKDYYEDSGTLQVIDDDCVMDDFVRTLQPSSDDNIPDYRSCAYDMPATTFGRQADIDDEVLQLVTIHENAIGYGPTDWRVQMSPAASYVIEHDSVRDIYYRNRSPRTSGNLQEGGEVPVQVMQLQHVTDPEATSDVTFSIVPAEVMLGGAPRYEGLGFWGVGNILVLVSPEYDQEEEVGLEQVINGGGVQNKAWDTMQVAFYHGSLPSTEEGTGGVDSETGKPYLLYHDDMMPMCIIQRYTLDEHSLIGYPATITGCEGETLELGGDHGRVANDFTNRRIDSSQQYVVQFVSHRKLDAGKLFLIRNKLFYCKQLRYRFGQNDSHLVEGTFYPAQ